MRFRHPGGEVVHLAYCSNVHPAEDLDGVIGQVERFVPGLRAGLDADGLGIGLWLPALVARELASDASALKRLATALDDAGAEVVTCNAFPYGGFHAPVVKHAVYRPDWAEPERLDYTRDVAQVLARLLPDDVAEGSISTLPLGWREGWEARHADALAALDELAADLHQLADATGRRIRLALEPEPGCTVETTAQAVEALASVDTEVIGVCLDACHTAVQFEQPAEAVARITGAGLRVVKSQVSSALRVPEPAGASERLAEFVEPRFLHQTRLRTSDGAVVGTDDLDEALADEGGLPRTGEWRVHFHVPVHVGSQETTQDELVAMLGALVGGAAPVTRHLEAETYTWSVLPADRRPTDDEGLIDGMARELSWVRDRLVDAGLQAI